MIPLIDIYRIMNLDFQMPGLMMLVIFYVFDLRCQGNFTAAQPIKLGFNFDGSGVPNDISGHALAIRNKLVSLSSDGQIHLILFKPKAFITSLFFIIVKYVFFSKALL